MKSLSMTLIFRDIYSKSTYFHLLHLLLNLGNITNLQIEQRQSMNILKFQKNSPKRERTYVYA